MNNDYIYVLLKINKGNGEIKMIRGKDEKMKEIEEIYKKMNIKNANKIPKPSFDKNIGRYDNNKKSRLDDKTSVRIGSNYYGRLV